MDSEGNRPHLIPYSLSLVSFPLGRELIRIYQHLQCYSVMTQAGSESIIEVWANKSECQKRPFFVTIKIVKVELCFSDSKIFVLLYLEKMKQKIFFEVIRLFLLKLSPLHCLKVGAPALFFLFMG